MFCAPEPGRLTGTLRNISRDAWSKGRAERRDGTAQWVPEGCQDALPPGDGPAENAGAAWRGAGYAGPLLSEEKGRDVGRGSAGGLWDWDWPSQAKAIAA